MVHKRSVHTFSVLDEGSSISLIDEDLANELQLEGVSSQLSVQWFGRQSTVVDSNILSTNPHLSSVPFCYYENAQPKILLGLDNHHLGVPRQVRTNTQSDSIVAMDTKLGWVLYGSDGNTKCRCYAHKQGQQPERVRTFALFVATLRPKTLALRSHPRTPSPMRSCEHVKFSERQRSELATDSRRVCCGSLTTLYYRTATTYGTQTADQRCVEIRITQAVIRRRYSRTLKRASHASYITRKPHLEREPNMVSSSLCCTERK